MSNDTRPFRRRRIFGLRPEPPLFETGDYTIPDPLDARLAAPDELLVTSDFDDGESTTITRHRVR
jgi:hypothetical protein